MTHEMSLFKAQLFAGLVSLALLLVVVELVRKRRLMEEYSVLWLIAGGSLLLLSIWKGLLIRLSELVGIAYPPSLIFLVAFFFCLLLFVHFSVLVSQLRRETKRLAQELALTRHWLEEEGARGPESTGLSRPL